MRRRFPTWIAHASGVIALCSMTACVAPIDGEAPSEVEVTGTESSAIYGGTVDNGAQQNAAVVAIKVGAEGLCSGALIAPNVVLTARHCVSANITKTVECDEKGQSLNGDHLAADVVPSSLAVYVGVQPNLRGTPVAHATQIVHAATNILCNADMAVIVLDKSIPNVKPLRVRLSKATRAGETVRSVGYGQNDTAQPVGTRLRRAGVSVRAVGAKISGTGTRIATHEFEVGESVCNGDSGGPAISESSGAIVGVVSRGGDCTLNYGQIYTSLVGFDGVFQQAFKAAGGAVVDEEGGELSGVSADAASTTDGGSSTAGTVRGSSSKVSARPSVTTSNGDCAVGAIGGGASPWGAIVVAAAAALGAVRRRRR